MQESRRRSGLEQHLLSVTLYALAGCASAARPESVSGAPQATPKSEQGPLLPPALGEKPASASPSTAALTRTVAPDGSAPANDATEPASARSSEPQNNALPKDTLVLHIGDSFAGSLGIPLGKRFKAAGLRSVLEFETASYVPTWASGKELPKYIDKYRPQLVLVTLGANEVELTNPEQRAGAVRRLVQKLGGRPCVWITPPLWKPDTGIFRVIRENIAPCRYLDSDTIVHALARRRDHIHPSDAAREVWADAVLAWLARELQGGEGRPWELRPGP